MNIQDKYKWNGVKLQGQLWARGLQQKVMDLHNDALDALAIEFEQGIRDEDDVWREILIIEDENRECKKILNEIQQDLSDTDTHQGNSKKHYKRSL